MSANIIDIATHRRVAPDEGVPDSLVLLCYFMQHGPVHIPASFIETPFPPWEAVLIPVSDATGGGYIFKLNDREAAGVTAGIRPGKE